jgi:uncharacterized protein YidB (DUF937 family)
MGLFDQIAGQVLGSLSGQAGQAVGAAHPGVLEAITGLLGNAQSGGLQGLISAFQQQGLGDVVASWVGTGQNLPISADQIQQVLGNAQVQAIAQQVGLPTAQISQMLAQFLPQAVDTVTPGGTVPTGDAASLALGALGSLFGKT